MELERTLPHLFQEAPAGGTMTILGRESGEEVTRSYEDLLESGERAATGLAERGVEPGDPVALLARTTFDFIIGCLAVWRRGAVVVPVAFPARFVSREAWLQQTHALTGKAGAKAVILGEGDAPFESEVPSYEFASLMSSGSFDDPMPSPSDVAVIQFTSGSTSRPKGIVLEHQAVVQNVDAVGERIGPYEKGDVLFSWLPLYHDMGYINYFLRPLAGGFPVVYLATELFVRSPIRWAIETSAYRATTASAPNFAYGLLARELETCSEPLDLSCWTYAASGGETVSTSTLERFKSAAGRFGLPSEACTPGYGLAEATCTVTARSRGTGWLVDHVDRDALSDGKAAPLPEGSPGAAAFASVGRALAGTEIAIFDERGDPLPERGVGEIVVKTPSVMRGYLDDPVATAETLRDGWLHTGDRGYLLDDELYVTGRIKDIVIVHGRNYHAEDIERVVEGTPGVRPGNSVAVSSVSNGTEGLAVLAETKATDVAEARKVRDAIVRKVLAETGITPQMVVMLEPRSVPKTSSGKLRRGEAKRMLEEGNFAARELK